jgi:hypothetical protein
MTQLRFSALGLILAVVLSFQSTHAQQTNPSNNDQAAEAAVREKAFSVLETLSDQLSSLQSPENRARIGANIADSIWPHDDRRARALFTLVEQDINLGLQSAESDRDASHTFAVYLRLREETIERIARHDAELALGFLKRTEPQPQTRYSRALLYGQQKLELGLAKKIAAENPEIAVKLARQNLGQGLSNDLLVLLIRLAGKDKQQANTFYKDVVAKIRDTDLTQSWSDIDFTTSLVRFFTPPAADESTYRELIGVLVAKANAYGCGNRNLSHEDQRVTFCFRMGSLAPILERVAGEQASRLRQWAPRNDDYEFVSVPTGQGRFELDDVAATGSVAEVLALTSKYPSLESQIYLRALSKAESEGDVEQAQKVANAYAGNDPNVRSIMESKIRAYSVSAEKIEQQVAEMQKKLDEFPPRRQLGVLLGLANQVLSNDPKTALKLLNQANGLVDSMLPGEEQLGSQFALALLYCQAKSDRGFAIMESLLPKLNELVAAAAKLDGLDTRYLRDGEWNMSAEGGTGRILTALAHYAAPFAWYDFDRAINLAAQFERPEIRMMAQLKLAQGILAGSPKRLPISAVRLDY